MRYFFLLLLIVASIGVFIAFIVPRYHVVEATRADVATYTADLATATQLQQSRQSLIAQYNAIQKNDLDNIKTLLPDSVDNIRLIIQMNSLATKDGLSSLRAVDFDPSTVPTTTSTGTTATTTTTTTDPSTSPGSNQAYGQFVISFQTSGQYSNFLTFLSDLEQNLRLVDVTNIAFTSATNTTTGAPLSPASGLSYKVTLTTYWLKQ